MQVTIDTKDLTKQLAKDVDKFHRKFLPLAEKRTLLRVSRSAISRWSSQAAKQARVKVGLMKKRSSNKPHRSGGRVISINAATMPLVILGPKGRLPKQTRNGIRVAGRHVPKGFIATARLGKRPQRKAIFERDGKPRAPISEQRVKIHPAVASTINVPRLVLDERFDKEMTHQLNRIISTQRR
jgi:hypothetical protein